MPNDGGLVEMTVYWSEVAPPNLDGHKELKRIEVPGGWLYHLVGDGLCFVPTPPSIFQPCEYSVVDVDFKEIDQKEKAS